jgi:hypothetical protein
MNGLSSVTLDRSGNFSSASNSDYRNPQACLFV